ncbi:unnamed protein product [Brassica oleracea var. botrytis]
MEVRKRKNADGGASVNAGDDRTPSSVSSTSDRTVRSKRRIFLLCLAFRIKSPRLIQSIFSALGDLYLYKLSDALYGDDVASWSVSFLCTILSHSLDFIQLYGNGFLFCQMANWVIFFCTFSNCLETVLSYHHGLYYWPCIRDPSKAHPVNRKWSLVIAALACALRPTSAII